MLKSLHRGPKWRGGGGGQDPRTPLIHYCTIIIGTCLPIGVWEHFGWGGAEGLICPKFYTDNHKHHPPLDIARVTSSTLPKFEKHPYSWTFTSTPPPGHCLCDVIIHIPKGLICSFLWPIFSSYFARISPTVCPNFTHCLPEFGGGSCSPLPPPPRLIRLCVYLHVRISMV